MWRGVEGSHLVGEFSKDFLEGVAFEKASEGCIEQRMG